MFDDNFWYEVPGYEGLYFINTRGEIFSNYTNKKLKPSITPNGYLRLQLFKNRVGIYWSIHRLVALAFLSLNCVDEGLQVCHNDGNKLNNYYTNLRLDTALGNAKDKIKHGKTPKGERNPKAKLTEDEIKKIRNLFKDRKRRDKPYLKDIAKRYGVDRQSISNILKNKTWKE